MSMRTVAEIIGEIFLGTALAAALIFGIIELADLMVEMTDELSR